MDELELKNIIEVLLLSTSEPITCDSMLGFFEQWQQPSLEQIKKTIAQLIEEYRTRPLEIVLVASGYRVQTRAHYAPWIARMQEEKPSKYSRAMLETLAIIAYKQPVTRADIEELRGVAVSSQIIKTLVEREWIRRAGYKDVAGKPAVYRTTKEFLNYFNLQHLHELPAVHELMESLNPHREDVSIKECLDNE